MDWVLPRKLVLLSIEHPVLLNECLVHEIVLPDESVQRRQEDPHSILLVEEAGCQVVDEVLLGVWHQQAVKIMVHKLVKCCDLFELLEHLSVTPGYREQASEVLSIATIFASLGHIDIVKGQELHQDVDITVFCERGLSHARHLVYLDLSQNNLGVAGIQSLCGKGLLYCRSVRYLDLFDVDLGNGALK